MNIKFLVDWIKSAVIDEYESCNKQVIVATNGNEQLILYRHQVGFNIVWLSNGTSELLYQDCSQITHSNLAGEDGPRENVETVWCALKNRQISS
jgi:hypothetical protein